MWYTEEYFSALNIKEILTHATTWINFEDVMLSEIRQSQKNKYCMVLLTWRHQEKSELEKGSRTVVFSGWGAEERS